uniref:Uncharacterized protein n=1 Tax=Hyaloperonospora arabidopsidis (strain Emoy2) TaxID=559515 RepID=M4BJV6_HYAAE
MLLNRRALGTQTKDILSSSKSTSPADKRMGTPLMGGIWIPRDCWIILSCNDFPS